LGEKRIKHRRTLKKIKILVVGIKKNAGYWQLVTGHWIKKLHNIVFLASGIQYRVSLFYGRLAQLV
jgi:hypothetical protein